MEAAISRERHYNKDTGHRRLGIDVARYGDDRTVFTLRDGANVEKVKVEAKLSTMEVAGIIVSLIKQWTAHAVYIDVIGIGAGVYDRLVEMKKEADDYGRPKIAAHVQIVPVNVTEKAPARPVLEAQPYRLRNYLWLEMADWLRDSEPSQLASLINLCIAWRK